MTGMSKRNFREDHWRGLSGGDNGEKLRLMSVGSHEVRCGGRQAFPPSLTDPFGIEIQGLPCGLNFPQAV